jgi:dTDP-4-dehydrorhamnose 3,5-epimerase-like enzyme
LVYTSEKGINMIIPIELSQYFDRDSFANYPLVKIPQSFSDERGRIINIADGALGDVSLIETRKHSVRANHYHNEDWHLCFLLDGSFNYIWLDLSAKEAASKIIQTGEMVFTPKEVIHRLEFLEDSRMIVVSKLSRISDNYEEDTFRVAKKLERRNKC